jgi:hypothetical protein
MLLIVVKPATGRAQIIEQLEVLEPQPMEKVGAATGAKSQQVEQSPHRCLNVRPRASRAITPARQWRTANYAGQNPVLLHI